MSGSSYMAARIALRHGLSAEDKGLGAKERALANCHAYLIAAAIALFGAALLAQPASARFNFNQQGQKLVGTGVVGTSIQQGFSVALSADGNTAIIGGPYDNNFAGAAWVFTRSSGTWMQQQKLVATGAAGAARQGQSVALSADGNTAIVGGPYDNNFVGAAWVWTRSNGTWTQQQKLAVDTSGLPAGQGFSVALSADGNTVVLGGPAQQNNFAGEAWVWTRSNGMWTEQQNLVANDSVGAAQQGQSVALSADGNTAIVGGPGDNSLAGAAWVFTRSNGKWMQQGQKLVGTGAVGAAQQGYSVGLSADGNTAIVGGPFDNNLTNPAGAAWVWTRSNGMWTQQGQKLVGTVGNAQGFSVTLSGDGNTAIVGGPNEGWVFSRFNGMWTQQGGKLVGTGAVGNAEQGTSVALSADGDTAILGGPDDNSFVGAAWVFFRDPAATHDFNGDGNGDILWRDTSGNTAAWLMNGGSILQAGGYGAVPGWSVVGQRDFNGDGMYDLLWRDTSGNTAIWLLNGLSIFQTGGLGNIPTTWAVAGTADFNGDGKGDILWLDNTGNAAIWLMNSLSISQAGGLGNVNTWTVAGTADFNGDGKADILWYNGGLVAIWLMNGLQISQTGGLGFVSTQWSIVGTGDFNGDSNGDILWKDAFGNVAIWLMNGLSVLQAGGLGNVGTSWNVAETGDYNGDGKSDILWRDSSGNTAIWFMNGLSIGSTAGLGNIPTSWTIQGVNAD
jgi:hypothetical protein